MAKFNIFYAILIIFILNNDPKKQEEKEAVKHHKVKDDPIKPGNGEIYVVYDPNLRMPIKQKKKPKDYNLLYKYLGWMNVKQLNNSNKTYTSMFKVKTRYLKLLGVQLFDWNMFNNTLSNQPVYYSDYYYIPNVVFDRDDNILVPYTENGVCKIKHIKKPEVHGEYYKYAYWYVPSKYSSIFDISYKSWNGNFALVAYRNRILCIDKANNDQYYWDYKMESSSNIYDLILKKGLLYSPSVLNMINEFSKYPQYLLSSQYYTENKLNLSPNITFGVNYFSNNANLSVIPLNSYMMFKSVSINNKLIIFKSEFYSTFHIIWATFNINKEGITCEVGWSEYQPEVDYTNIPDFVFDVGFEKESIWIRKYNEELNEYYYIYASVNGLIRCNPRVVVSSWNVYTKERMIDYDTKMRK